MEKTKEAAGSAVENLKNATNASPAGEVRRRPPNSSATAIRTKQQALAVLETAAKD